MTPYKIGRRLHYRRRASLCRRPWCRYQRKPLEALHWLPSWQTYQLLMFFEVTP
jgi:hypothetical protein